MGDYKPPIAETEDSKISAHNKAQMAPGHAFAVSSRHQEKDSTLKVLNEISTSGLRGLFSDLVAHDVTKPVDGKGSLIIFHAINENDEANITNSKLSALHFHVIAGPLAEGHEHIEQQKTYVPHPNAKIADVIEAHAQEEWHDKGFGTITCDKDTSEAATHKILVNPGYDNLAAFTSEASDLEIEEFAHKMITLIEPFVKECEGGTRIIIDERYNPAGSLAVHFIGGEYLGQEPDKKHRWFQSPAP